SSRDDVRQMAVDRREVPYADIRVWQLPRANAFNEVFLMQLRVNCIVVLHHFAGLVEDFEAPAAVVSPDVNHAFRAIDADAILHLVHTVWIPDAHFPD